MKRIKAHCGSGFAGAVYDEDFEFPDDAPSEEITEVVSEWADQFVESWWEEMENVE